MATVNYRVLTLRRSVCIFLTPYSPVVTLCTTSFKIHEFYVLPTQCVYVFCMDLRTNSDYFLVQHSLIGFYNRNGQCLLRGTD
jgi:hypothetical protein